MPVFFLWHCDSVLQFHCSVSFRSMLFHLEFFCILIFLLLSTSVVQEVQFEKHLDLALNFHVRMMIDSLALSKRTNC